MTPSQLTLDGGEVQHPPPRPRPLTEAQRAILTWVRAKGSIRSSEAGVLVHFHHPHGPGYYCGRFTRGSAVGCCEFAANAGLSACKRLAARGLLERKEPGQWTLPQT